jgi:LPXTG-motif cell wall-anchored protein
MTYHVAVVRRGGVALISLAVAAAAVLLMFANTASAAIVPTVPLGTSANYSVLGGQTVTNTGPSVLHGSLGVSPGSSITGFGGAPNGTVVPPAVTDQTNAAAAQAQSDLTAAYLNAHGRALTATTAPNLTGLTLQGGVYAAASKGALGLTGTLTLDGAGNANTVFIFQTNSTLISGSGSRVNLINGALACNVFWQIGSSATLGTNSDFSGTILALTSISVKTNVTVHGQALARNGAVTLDDDVFIRPPCAQTLPTTTTSATSATTTTTAPTTVTTRATQLPHTGSSTSRPLAAIALGLCVGGLAITGLAKRRRAAN